MIGFLAVVTVIMILLFPYVKDSKYREIERHQAMRRAMIKLQEKLRNYSL
jgi:hypothetical protein